MPRKEKGKIVAIYKIKVRGAKEHVYIKAANQGAAKSTLIELIETVKPDDVADLMADGVKIEGAGTKKPETETKE